MHAKTNSCFLTALLHLWQNNFSAKHLLYYCWVIRDLQLQESLFMCHFNSHSQLVEFSHRSGIFPRTCAHVTSYTCKWIFTNWYVYSKQKVLYCWHESWLGRILIIRSFLTHYHKTLQQQQSHWRVWVCESQRRTEIGGSTATCIYYYYMLDLPLTVLCKLLHSHRDLQRKGSVLCVSALKEELQLNNLQLNKLVKCMKMG